MLILKQKNAVFYTINQDEAKLLDPYLNFTNAVEKSFELEKTNETELLLGVWASHHTRAFGRTTNLRRRDFLNTIAAMKYPEVGILLNLEYTVVGMKVSFLEKFLSRCDWTKGFRALDKRLPNRGEGEVQFEAVMEWMYGLKRVMNEEVTVYTPTFSQASPTQPANRIRNMIADNKILSRVLLEPVDSKKVKEYLYSFVDLAAESRKMKVKFARELVGV